MPRAARSRPAHGTGREGALSPRKRRTRDSPELDPTGQVGVPRRLAPPQYEPVAAACKNELSTVLTAGHGYDFYPRVFTQGGQLTKPPPPALKISFLPRA